MTDDELSGARLSAAFFQDIVAPLLGRAFPGLRYAAGRLGSGSDVLGLDDAMSRDHDWGCRLTVLAEVPGDSGPGAAAELVARISQVLEEDLPDDFGGHPVRFPVTWDPAVSHKVEVATVAGFAASRLGLDPSGGLSALDWLCLTGQSVLEVTAGPVFADGTTTLSQVRKILHWYPPDVERYVLAAGWQRVQQQMPMVGRTGESGDDLGSRILSAKLAEDLMWLAFTLSRRWQPYAKWRGTVFASLPVAGALGGHLTVAASASTWRDREDALAAAAEVLLDLQRGLDLPSPPRAVVPFFDRPYRTIDLAVPGMLLDSVTNPEVAALPPLIGSVEQWADSVDVLASQRHRAALRDTYREWMRHPAAG